MPREALPEQHPWSVVGWKGLPAHASAVGTQMLSDSWDALYYWDMQPKCEFVLHRQLVYKSFDWDAAAPGHSCQSWLELYEFSFLLVDRNEPSGGGTGRGVKHLMSPANTLCFFFCFSFFSKPQVLFVSSRQMFGRRPSLFLPRPSE